MTMKVDPLLSTPGTELQIVVFGADLDGFPIMERTKILTLTRDGATIPLTKKLAPDSELTVSNPATNQETAARVVGLIREGKGAHVYGIAFLDPSANLWHAEFPDAQPGSWKVMACSRCHTVERVSLTEVEARIFESKQALTRHCECSNSSTIWKHTERRVSERRATPRGQADRRQHVPSPEETSQAGREKRRDKRTAMKGSACIRFHGRESIVDLEDMSRGGFRFKGPINYPIGTQIEAAVPYSKGSVNIFVTCKIAYYRELPDGRHRHGVSYVRSLARA
jgi:PilZ domain